MKYFILVLVYCIALVQASVEVVFTSNNYNPVGTTYCHSELTGPLQKGEEISLEGECRKATCGENGGITIRKCKNIPISPCGIVAADFTQPFPICCPRSQPCPSKNI